MAALRDATIPEAGTTTFRPPFTPVAIGALAGRATGHHFQPFRRTPMHDWHIANGAEMLEVGLWMRPWFYRASGGDVNEAYVAEMRNVRQAAGLMDISTLGKIDVQGPERRFSSTVSMSTALPNCQSAVPATASCCATTASSSTTARRRALASSNSS